MAGGKCCLSPDAAQLVFLGRRFGRGGSRSWCRGGLRGLAGFPFPAHLRMAFDALHRQLALLGDLEQDLLVDRGILPDAVVEAGLAAGVGAGGIIALPAIARPEGVDTQGNQQHRAKADPGAEDAAGAEAFQENRVCHGLHITPGAECLPDRRAVKIRLHAARTSLAACRSAPVAAGSVLLRRVRSRYGPLNPVAAGQGPFGPAGDPGSPPHVIVFAWKDLR